MQNHKEQTANKSACIRVLNDRLRTYHIGGRIMLTSGVNTLEPNTVRKIIRAITQFTDFNERNDPHSEHDCAIMEVNNLSIMWKIDYYDETLTQHSPDPSDPNVTVRILTVMLADEY